MTPEQLFVLMLATWRIANLLVNESGPFDVFEWLRAQFDIRDQPYSGEKALRVGSDNVIGKMLLCIYCTSIWVAFGLTLAFLLLPLLTFWFCVGLALSTAACAIDHFMES